jgi:hypothetical protein
MLATAVAFQTAPLCPCHAVWAAPSFSPTQVANYHPTEVAEVEVPVAALGFPSGVAAATSRDVWAHTSGTSVVHTLAATVCVCVCGAPHCWFFVA